MSKSVAFFASVLGCLAWSSLYAGGSACDPNQSSCYSPTSICCSQDSRFTYLATIHVGYGIPEKLVNQPYFPDDHSVTFKARDTSYNHFSMGGELGYLYSLNPVFSVGLDAGYLYLGTQTIDGDAASATDTYYYHYRLSSEHVRLGLSLHAMIANRMDIYVEAGPAYTWQKMRFQYAKDHQAKTEEKVSTRLTQEALNPFAQIGVGFAWGDFELSASYLHVFANKSNALDWRPVSTSSPSKYYGKVISQSAFLLGLTYRFHDMGQMD